MALPNDEAEVAGLWDENAEIWARDVRAGRDAFREVFNNPMFLNFVPDLSGLGVLEAGCGEGHNTRLFARRGAKMTGVDISSRMLDAARKKEETEPLGIRYELRSFTNLEGFESESFDACISTMALMDGPDFRAAAREIYRVLRRQGGFYFSVTHPCFMTRDWRWIEESGKTVGKLVSNYWDEPYIERWGFRAGLNQTEDVFTIRNFPYRLEDYINGLSNAGYRITKIAEPRPTERMVSELPRLQPFRDHVPIFLHIAAAK